MRVRKLSWLPGLLLAVCALVLGPCLYVAVMASGRMETTTAAHEAPVALVLGASVYRDGTPSPALSARLDTAFELYRTGKARVLLVSGDNRTSDYNEPVAMRAYLVAKGVPAEHIVADYAGRSTYDSCYRASAIFGVSRLLVVSQDYHVPRAVATCRAMGLDATGVGDASFRGYRSTWARGVVREVPAALKLTADLLSAREPVLGDPEIGIAFALGK